MKKIKVLFVIRTLLRAGAERMLVNIANELVKNHHAEIAIYHVNPGNEFNDIIDPSIQILGGDIEFYFSIYKKNRFLNQNYINFVNEFQPDIIHSHLHYGDLLTHTYYFPKAKYFSHQHNSEVPEYKDLEWKKILSKNTWTNLYEFNWLKNKFKKFNTNFIACSAGTKELIEKKIGFGRIEVFPNAIPLPQLTYTHKTLNNNCLNLIWIGRLSDVKRPQLAIYIANELKNKGIRFKLKIVGDGIHYNNCLALIKNLNLENQVEMLGLINDMSAVYEWGEIMIHTAIYEGLPMVFVEANSNGIPIVSSDCMPNNEIIVEGENGFIIKSEKAIDFANVVEEIINNPISFQKLSKRSIEISQNFGISNYVEKLIQFYKS